MIIDLLKLPRSRIEQLASKPFLRGTQILMLLRKFALLLLLSLTSPSARADLFHDLAKDIEGRWMLEGNDFRFELRDVPRLVVVETYGGYIGDETRTRCYLRYSHQPQLSSCSVEQQRPGGICNAFNSTPSDYLMILRPIAVELMDASKDAPVCLSLMETLLETIESGQAPETSLRFSILPHGLLVDGSYLYSRY